MSASPADRVDLGPRAVMTCAAAVRVLTERLADLEYPVARPVRPCGNLDEVSATFDQAGYAVPPALVALWQHIGALCLVDLEDHRHVAFWADRLERWRAVGAPGGDSGWEPCCDGVVVDGPDGAGWVAYAVNRLEIADDEGWPVAIEIAPDELHKDNISGGGPYEVVLPGPGDDPWLAVLEGGFRWNGETRWSGRRPSSAPPDPPDLISYLRTALLECGGFPGLHGHPAYTHMLKDLSADLPVF